MQEYKHNIFTLFFFIYLRQGIFWRGNKHQTFSFPHNLQEIVTVWRDSCCSSFEPPTGNVGDLDYGTEQLSGGKFPLVCRFMPFSIFYLDHSIVTCRNEGSRSNALMNESSSPWILRSAEYFVFTEGKQHFLYYDT